MGEKVNSHIETMKNKHLEKQVIKLKGEVQKLELQVTLLEVENEVLREKLKPVTYNTFTTS